jgi:molybdate transport system regulatory protein
MQKTKSKEFRFRLWVDIDGEKFFGPGRAELLSLIEETGSISSAAKSMGMSYKKAWAMIDEMNAKAQTPYVVAQKGGQKGGGTALTPAGKDVVKSYQKIMDRIHQVLDKERSFLDLV